MSPPMTKLLLARPWRKISWNLSNIIAPTQPWVNNRIEYINNEIDDDNTCGKQDNQVFYNYQIPLCDGLKNKAAYPRQVKNIFNDNGASQ